MKLRRTVYGALSAAALVMLATGMTSCGKKKKSSSSDGEDTSKITVAGQLALSGESTSLALANPALDDLNVYCVTFAIPPVAGTGDINSEGKFELTLEASEGSVGCFILKEESILGTLVFEDSSKKSLDGGSQTSDRVAFNGGRSDLGTITLDLGTGKAVVDVTKITTSKIKDTTDVAATGLDFTGAYIATSDGIEIPKGYEGICANPDSGDCEGPAEGQKLWFKMIKGKTDDGKPAQAMMIWPSETAFNSCGKKLGMTIDEGKEKGIDFTDSGVDAGPFVWSAGYEDGWKKTSATAKYAMMKMDPVKDFNGYPGQKQWFTKYRTMDCSNGPCQESAPTTASGFMFNADTKDSGCREPDGKPIQLNDWNNMTCQGESLAGGLHKNTCKKTVNGKEITCINIGGSFLADGSPLQNAMARFPDDFEVYATPGALCSSINTSSDQGKLAQLRCYADALHEKNFGPGGDDSLCIRRVDGNWNAKTPDEFLPKNAVARPDNLHVYDMFKYTSATSGSLRGENKFFRGIQMGNNWTDCEVHEVFSISLTKISDSDDLMAEMMMTERNVSPKPACVAEFGEGKTTKYMFKLKKQ